MAGYRRTRAAAELLGVEPGTVSGREQRGQVREQARQFAGELPTLPKRSQERRERKRRLFVERMSEAVTPGQKVSVAGSYLAAALAEVPAPRADQVATAVVQYLQGLADQLMKEASR